MRISSTQPNQDLFLKDQAVLSNESNNLHGEEQSVLQENLDPSQDQTPRTYSAIRRSHPNNRPQLTIIKTDKTGYQEWSPLTKLALATAGIIKATALGYLAYTYKSTPPATPTSPITHDDGKNAPITDEDRNDPIEPLNIPTPAPTTTPNNFKKIDDPIVQDILNSESASNSPMLPLVLGATLISLAIGGIFGFLMSKLKADKAAFEDRILTLNNPLGQQISIDKDQQQIKSEIDKLNLEKAQLEQTKTQLEEQINQLNINFSESVATAFKQQQELTNQTETISLLETAKRQALQEATQQFEAEQNQIKQRLTTEITALQASKKLIEDQAMLVPAQHVEQIAELQKKIVAAQNELNQINLNLGEKRETEKTLTEKLNTLNEDFKEKSAKLEDALLQKTQSLNEELEKRTHNFTESLNESERVFNKKKSELEKMIEDEKGIKENYEKEIREAEEKIRAKRRECQEEISNLKATCSIEITDLKDSIHKQKQGLEEELKTKREELLKETEEIAKAENTKRGSFIAQTQSIIDAARKQQTQFVSKADEAKQQLNLVTKELDEKNLKLQELQIEIQKIEAQKLQALEENEQSFKMAQASYDNLVESIDEAKVAFTKKRQEYDQRAKEDYKKRISGLTDLLISHVESEHPPIQGLVSAGFIQLLKYSSREATEFAIKCLDKKGVARDEIVSNAFNKLIEKSQSVKTRFESVIKHKENSHLNEEKEQLTKTLSPYETTIFKQALSFATECKKRDVSYAIDSIKKLELETLEDILSTLLKNRRKLAIIFADLFLDLIAKEEKPHSQKIESFNRAISLKLKEIDSRIQERYLLAQSQDRIAFNLPEIINCLLKKAPVSKAMPNPLEASSLGQRNNASSSLGISSLGQGAKPKFSAFSPPSLTTSEQGDLFESAIHQESTESQGDLFESAIHQESTESQGDLFESAIHQGPDNPLFSEADLESLLLLLKSNPDK